MFFEATSLLKKLNIVLVRNPCFKPTKKKTPLPGSAPAGPQHLPQAEDAWSAVEAPGAPGKGTENLGLVKCHRHGLAFSLFSVVVFFVYVLLLYLAAGSFFG